MVSPDAGALVDKQKHTPQGQTMGSSKQQSPGKVELFGSHHVAYFGILNSRGQPYLPRRFFSFRHGTGEDAGGVVEWSSTAAGSFT